MIDESSLTCWGFVFGENKYREFRIIFKVNSFIHLFQSIYHRITLCRALLEMWVYSNTQVSERLSLRNLHSGKED